MPEVISLTYGKDRINFDIPENFLAGPVIEPRTGKVISGNPQEIICGALNNSADRFFPGQIVKDKVVGLISSDEFRSGLQKEIISVLAGEIIKGGPKKLKILVATGSHEIEIYAKSIKKWAEEIVRNTDIECEIIANDCYGNDFILIGKTSRGTPLYINRHLLSCEVRVYGHEAKYHYMNGYSCIDKQVLPGFASMETIKINHKNALDHKNSCAGRNSWHSDGRRQFNPFGMDIKEAREISERFFLDENGNLTEKEIRTFGLDMISDNGRIFWAMAGNPDLITKEMTKAVDSLSLFKVKKTRYVVISPGGSPACDTVYGTQNCFDMALKGAVQDGGEALVIAPCTGREDVSEEVRGLAPDANSKRLFWDNLVKLKDKSLEECSRFIDKSFELYLWKTDRVLKLMKENKVKIYFHSQLNPEKVREGGFIPVESIRGWIDERIKRADSKFNVIDNGNKILVEGEI
jgi:lactate racemase